MVVSFVGAFAAVLPSQLDPVALDLIYGADVDAIGADYFHVLFDLTHLMSSDGNR